MGASPSLLNTDIKADLIVLLWLILKSKIKKSKIGNNQRIIE
jgi:hypothetical protein